jgi:spore germination cell wall hydrolase CwlJ-like protein
VPPVINPDCLAALCIFAEARGEPWEGQVAVGNVVRNRMARRYASDGTVHDTVLRPLQFSWTNSSDKQRVRVFQCDDEDPRYLRAMAAWRASAKKRLVDGAVLYHSTAVNPGWAKAATVKLVRQIGAHVFYEAEG